MTTIIRDSHDVEYQQPLIVFCFCELAINFLNLVHFSNKIPIIMYTSKLDSYSFVIFVFVFA